MSDRAGAPVNAMSRRVRLIAVPYDSGHRGLRMGAGPLHFLAGGAAAVLNSDGSDAEVALVEATTEFASEIGTGFDLHRTLARTVSDATARGALPIVLAGNCGSAIGTVSGLRAGRDSEPGGAAHEIGVIWFDAHADLNTPESSTSGFLDGMSLATLTGRCWTALASSVPGFRPIRDEHVILAGARDIDAAESDLLRHSGIALASRGPTSAGSTGLTEALDSLQNRVKSVYVHLDLDVHDAAEVSANSYAQPGGFGTAALRDAVCEIRERFTIAGAGLTAYDPAFDSDGRMLAAGLDLMVAIAGG